MQKPSKQIQQFIDKLCDHLPQDRIKILIDNGFDEWQTITYLKGSQLVDLGFDTQECIVIMVAANANAQENMQDQIFSEQAMQDVIGLAKQGDQRRIRDILDQEEREKEKGKEKEQGKEQGGSDKQVPSNKKIPEYPHKEITQAMLIKGTFMKTKPGQKVPLQKAHMVSLQQKQLTHITTLQKCPNLQNLNLSNNHIYKLQNLQFTPHIKILNLQHNNIQKIECLHYLPNLQHLYLSYNYITRLEGLTNNPNLQELYISKQGILQNGNFGFQEASLQKLGYTLEKFQCRGNRVCGIFELRHLRVVKEVYLDKNLLEDVGELSEIITGMTNLRILSLKDNPLAKSQKYRDYIVILSKTLQELDGKKILAKQREYLVKLYALKHAKQSKQGQKPIKSTKQMMELQGVRVEEQYSGQANINKATDLRGNIPHANTKHYNKK